MVGEKRLEQILAVQCLCWNNGGKTKIVDHACELSRSFLWKNLCLSRIMYQILKKLKVCSNLITNYDKVEWFFMNYSNNLNKKRPNSYPKKIKKFHQYFARASKGNRIKEVLDVSETVIIFFFGTEKQ